MLTREATALAREEVIWLCQRASSHEAHSHFRIHPASVDAYAWMPLTTALLLTCCVTSSKLPKLCLTVLFR